MSIQELGQSLLARQERLSEEARERKRKREKKQKRTEMLAQTLKFGETVGNRILEERTVNFLNNEPNLQHKLAVKRANTRLKELQSIDDARIAKGQTLEQHYADSSINHITQAAARQFKEEFLNTDAYNSLIRQQADDYGKRVAAVHRETLNKGETVLSSKDYAGVIALANRRPTNITEWVADLFRGKTRGDIDQKAAEAIQNHASTIGAEEFNSYFSKEYEQARNIEEAYNLSQHAIPGSNDVEWTQQEVKVTPSSDGSSVIITRIAYHFDRGSTNWKNGKKPTSISDPVIESVDLSTDADRKKAAAAVLSSKLSAFNFLKDGRNILNTSGMQALRDHVPGNIKLSNIQTIDEYNKVAGVFAKVMSVQSNLKDPVNEAHLAKMIEGWNSTFFQKLITLQVQRDSFYDEKGILKKDTNEIRAEIGRIETEIIKYASDRSEELSIFRETYAKASDKQPSRTGVPGAADLELRTVMYKDTNGITRSYVFDSVEKANRARKALLEKVIQ